MVKTWLTQAISRSMGELTGFRPVRKYPFVERDFRYRKNLKILSSILSKKYLKTKSVPAGHDQIADSELYSLWQTIPGGHKWCHYFPFYDEVLSKFRSRPVKLLEVGVFRGATLALWRKYHHPETVIVGIDINPDATRFDDPNSNVHVRIGDQSDREFLNEVVKQFGPFDIIIDDGSHIVSHMITTFDHLFLDGLVPGGLYIVEDLHTNYWDSHRDRQVSFVDLARELVDVMHSPYWQSQSAEFRVGDERRLISMELPQIAREIKEIRFRDSLILFERASELRLPVAVVQPDP